MNEKHMQHGEDWCGEMIAGWIATEKFNGCRAYWDGVNLWSRGGIAAQIPQSWRDALPPIPLDCELYDGIDGVYRCGAALRYGRFTGSMRLMVFDAPACVGPWVDRMDIARLQREFIQASKSMSKTADRIEQLMGSAPALRRAI